MNYGDGSVTLDPAAVALLDRNNNSGFGNGEGAWWIIIFLVFAMMGWGRNGFGSNGFGACCAPATQQGMADAFNFNNLDNAVRGVQNGLCDGFYAMNTSILNLGQSLLQCCCDVKTGIMQNGYETREAINSNANNITSGITDLGYKMQDCCCTTQRAIDSVKYENAKNTCDIINANNANTQKIIDHLTQSEINSLRTELQSAQLQLSNNAQSRYIIDQIKPCPIPAYLTCSPYQSYNYNPYNNCGCSCGC